jgi:beta-lactamase class A
MSRLTKILLSLIALATAIATASFGVAGEPTEHAAAAERVARAAVDPPALAELERREGARIGVFALDTGSGWVVQHRADERYPFASTIKAMAAGVAFRRASVEQLARVVEIEPSDVIRWSPLVEDHIDMGLSLQALVNASLQWSDNAAVNLVVKELGGLEQFERELRALGDRVTSIDRPEPDLNEAVPGDKRDTTTPRTIGQNLRRLLLDDVLAPRRRELLRSMMLANTTGDRTIRAGVPQLWKVADKTGTAGYGTRNDIAVAWPPHGKPVVLVVYTTHPSSADAPPDDGLVAEATRIAVKALQP